MPGIHETTASKRVYEESAAASTPATGFVAVYAKTDGKLYIKDDAGSETDLTAGGSSGVDSGTSFPGTPSSGDLFFHTTHDVLFTYDGTRWICTCPHEMTFNTKDAVVFSGISISTNPISRAVVPWKATLGIWLAEWDLTTIVLTPNDGSNFWLARLGSTVLGGTNTDLATGISTSGDTNTTHAHHTEALAAVLDANATYMDVDVTKTLSPGNFYTSGPPVVRFRYIGT